MKNDYTIHEISSLYGIGPDSLRYYERLGLIHPRRAPNGYRLYNLRDIYRLTIIRDLRQLGFSMERIGEYLAGMRLDNTLALLKEEQALILQKQRELRAAERAIRERLQSLRAFATTAEDGIALKQIPDRPCVRLNTDISRDEEMDFAVKRLHRRHADTIRDLGGQKIGASMQVSDIHEGIYGLFRSVFFLLDAKAVHFDFLLPGGQYARLLYRGSYKQSPKRTCELLDWVKQNGYAASGDVLELYHIDNRFTLSEEEFLTELQVRLEPHAEKKAPLV